MNKASVAIIAMSVAFAIVISSFTVSEALSEPGAIVPEPPAQFQSYMNNTLPTGHGFFNVTVAGSTAEFGYAFFVSGNPTLMTGGYANGFQVSISIISESLGISVKGFSATVSNVNADYGIQHFHYQNTTTNYSGISSFGISSHAFGMGDHVLLYNFVGGGGIVTVHSTFNVSFDLVPIFLQGPFHATESPFLVHRVLKTS